MFALNGESGIRTHAPHDKRLSRPPRYDCLISSPNVLFDYTKIRNVLSRVFLIYFFLFFLTLLLFISSSVIISWLEVYVKYFYIFQKLFSGSFQTLLNIQKCPSNDQIFRQGYLYIIMASPLPYKQEPPSVFQLPWHHL